MPDINMQVFEEAQRNQLVTEVDIQTQVALDDYQVQLSDIANPTQSQDNVIIDRHGEFLPHWNESLDFDTWVKMSMEVAGKRLLMLSGNSNKNSASNGSDTFIQYNGATTTQYLKSILVPTNQDLRYKIKMKGTGSVKAGISNNQNFASDDSNYCQIHSAGTYHSSYNDASVSYESNPAIHTDNVYRIYEGRFLTGVNSKGYFDSTLIATHTTNLPNENVGLGLQIETGTGAQEWAFLAKYTATEPTVTVDGEQNLVTALKSLGRAG